LLGELEAYRSGEKVAATCKSASAPGGTHKPCCKLAIAIVPHTHIMYMMHITMQLLKVEWLIPPENMAPLQRSVPYEWC
ncbi:unnamed protein product, partial [Urochloa humidicola]